MPTGGPGPVFAIHWRSEAHGPVLQRCSGRHSRCCKDVFFIVVYSLLVAANVCKISGKMCILPRMIVENTLYRAFRLIIAPNRPRSVWQNGCSYHIFVGSGVQHGLGCRCPAMVAMPAVPCPEPVFSRGWPRWRAVRQTAAVLPFCQIVSLFRPAAQPPGCQRVAVWAVLNGKTARFAALNGRFCGLVRAVWPVRHGMAWAASRRCNYFVPCFRKAAGWLAVI